MNDVFVATGIDICGESHASGVYLSLDEAQSEARKRVAVKAAHDDWSWRFRDAVNEVKAKTAKAASDFSREPTKAEEIADRALLEPEPEYEAISMVEIRRMPLGVWQGDEAEVVEVVETTSTHSYVDKPKPAPPVANQTFIGSFKIQANRGQPKRGFN